MPSEIAVSKSSMATAANPPLPEERPKPNTSLTTSRKGVYSLTTTPITDFVKRTTKFVFGVDQSVWIREMYKSIHNQLGAQGVKEMLLAQHTGMGVVAGLLVTITVSALLNVPQVKEDTAYPEPARFIYLIGLLASTWFNLRCLFRLLTCSRYIIHVLLPMLT